MYCYKCGNKLSENEEYCSVCGTKIVKPSDKIKMECKSCGGTMEVDRGMNVLSCPYCGSKEMFIESDDVQRERIKQSTSLEKEKLRLKYYKKNRMIDILHNITSEHTTVVFIIFAAFWLLFILCMIVIGIIFPDSSSSEVENGVSIGNIEDYIDTDYNGFIEKLESLGFTDIKDIDIGGSGLLNMNNNKITCITINGETDFDKYDKFTTDASIIIEHK